MSFIKDCVQSDRPFFCYVPTNAAHGPYRVAESYKQLYDSDTRVPNASFYGMISNIDDNIARLMRFLKANHLEDNTISIFMTDNGSTFGSRRGRCGWFQLGCLDQTGIDEAGEHKTYTRR